LPLYWSLDMEDVKRIIHIIKDELC
jgi:hypothetical protein